MTRRPKVLVIEDDPADAELLRAAFAEVAPEVDLRVAEHGLGGLEAARAQEPDLIVLDLVLPDVSGLAVLMGLHQNAPTRLIPVIVLSRYQDDGNVWQAYQEHANAFIVKPHDYDGLLRLVSALHVFWFRFVLLARPDSEPADGQGMPSRRE